MNIVGSAFSSPTSGSADPSANPYGFDLSASVPDFLDSYVAESESRGYEDVAILLSALKQGDPDALVLDAYGAPLGYVLQSVE